MKTVLVLANRDKIHLKPTNFLTPIDTENERIHLLQSANEVLYFTLKAPLIRSLSIGHYLKQHRWFSTLDRVGQYMPIDFVLTEHT